MAKKKIQCEVEEKGLDPTKPHSLLGEDNRLLPVEVLKEVALENHENSADNNLSVDSSDNSKELNKEATESAVPVSDIANNETVNEAPKPKKGRPAKQAQ